MNPVNEATRRMDIARRDREEREIHSACHCNSPDSHPFGQFCRNPFCRFTGLDAAFNSPEHSTIPRFQAEWEARQP